MKKFLSLFCLIAIAWLCNVAHAETVDDVITASNLAAQTVNTYENSSNVTLTSGATYAGNSSISDAGAIQLRSKNSNSGIVSTASAGKVKKVVVEWNSATTNGRVLDVYGNNSAYTAASDLYSTTKKGEKLGSIVCGTSTELVIERDFKYIGLRSNSGAMYLQSITITWEKEVEATELTAPVISISGVGNGGVYWNSATVNISKPKFATSIAYEIKKGEEIVASAAATTEAFSQVFSEEGTYTMTASATDGTDTKAAEAVSFEIKSTNVSSIADFLAKSELNSTATFTFTCPLTVTYANGKNVYVRDTAGDALLIYNSATVTGLVNGSMLEGVAGTYYLYNIIPEIKTTSLPTATAGEAVEPKLITIGDAAANLSQYVKIDGVKFNPETVISCGEETIEVSGTLPADVTAQYNVVGLISQSKSSGEWLPNLLIVSYEEVQVLGTPGIEVTGDKNATGSYLDKATLKFVYPANATSMGYVVKKGETLLEQAGGLTKDATYDITICGDISIEVTATNGTDQTNESKTIKVIPSAPTVSLAAGTYHEAQELTITAPEGATLVGLLNETVFENVSEYTTTLEVVNDDITTYKLDVWSTKDGVSSDAVSATFVINPNVIDATVTGDIVIADQDAEKFIATSSRMEKDKEYILTDNFGTEFTIKTVSLGSGGSLYPGRFSSNGSQLRMNNVGDVVSITSPYAINSVTLTADAAFKINDTDIEAVNGTYTWTNESGADVYSFTITSTVAKKNITKIAINYTGRFDYYKVNDGAALIGMKKGKLYKVNVALQGVKANDGVLYARTSEPSAKPSEPNKNYFDKSYEDYDWEKYVQRDWVVINGLTSDYEGKEVETGFIASYDGETLTPVATAPAIGDAADVTNINTFSVANVFYGNYQNTSSLFSDGYEPFFVKAKVNEVANYAGTLSKDSASEGSVYRLTGSGVCGKFEGKGVLIEPANEAITAALDEKLGQYQIIEGVLLTETSNGLANGDVKIVALAGPTDAPTGVAALKADGKATVYGTEGAVVVNGADGKVMIFDAMGRMVKSVNAEGAATVAMPAGYYIVRTAGTAAKVMVK